MFEEDRRPGEIVSLPKSAIDGAFKGAGHQAEYCTKLYSLAFGAPRWKRIKQLDGYPVVSPATGQYIFEKAIAFDRKHHPDVQAGGLWMNRGFGSSGYDLPDWKVRLCGWKE